MCLWWFHWTWRCVHLLNKAFTLMKTKWWAIYDLGYSHVYVPILFLWTWKSVFNDLGCLQSFTRTVWSMATLKDHKKNGFWVSFPTLQNVADNPKASFFLTIGNETKKSGRLINKMTFWELYTLYYYSFNIIRSKRTDLAL